ncbi:hypothetical protein EYS14_17615 [Alteromonadaceae bacterium M269]|nr:hypothetical protein EYS14_17615 [Alteromonadaceae bacterium M269]
MTHQDENITILLNEYKLNNDAQNQLFKRVYQQLREIAFKQLRTEQSDSTYGLTSLVDESFIRLSNSDNHNWLNRRQYYAAIAKTMKRILIEHARHNLRKGREHKYQALEFQEAFHFNKTTSKHISQLNDALSDLSKKKPELAELVELKFFIGLDIKEIANVMECSMSSIDRRWALAKAWLTTAMNE